MIEDNRVFRHWDMWNSADEVLEEFAGDPEAFPKIRRKDIMELNEALSQGERLSRDWEALELAEFNLRTADELGLRRTDLRKCGRTLLELAAKAAGGVRWTWPAVCYALDLFKPKELGMSGYIVCLQVANALIPPADSVAEISRGYTESIEYYERAAALTEHLDSVPESERTRLRAYALARAGHMMVLAGDRASGRKKLEEALSLLSSDSAEQDTSGAETRAQILQYLAGVLLDRKDKRAALERQQEAVDILRGLAVTKCGDNTMLVSALWRQSDLQKQVGEYGDARSSLRQAIEWSREIGKSQQPIPGLSTDLLLSELTEVLRKDGRDDEADELLERVLDEEGVKAAALAGHETARAVWFLRWNRVFLRAGLSELPLYGTREEPEWLSGPRSNRLLELLNVSPALVQQMASECQAQLDKAKAQTEHKKYQSLGVAIGGLSEGPRGLEFYRCVLILQRMADSICKGEYVLGEDGSLRFRGFVLEEVETLHRVVDRGNCQITHYIQGGPPGEEGLYNYAFPEGEGYAPLPPDELVDLCVMTEGSLDWGAAVSDFQIWEAFSQLAVAARDEGRPLRRCRMPRGMAHHLDYLLGERAEDAPICGTFYVAYKGAGTCGRAGCVQNQWRLNWLDRELSGRAEELAERLWKKADVTGDFSSMWEAAQGPDPKQSLLRFRELLNFSKRNS